MIKANLRPTRPRQYAGQPPSLNHINKLIKEARSSYGMATETRFSERPKGIRYDGSSEDWHLKNGLEYYQMIELGRFLERESLTASRGIDRLIENTIGEEGFLCRPDTGNDEADRLLKEMFDEDTAPNLPVDYSGEYDWQSLQHFLPRRMITDGDIGLNPLSNDTVQILEGHIIRSPRLRGGIERLKSSEIVHGVQRRFNGRRIRYWFMSSDRTSTGRTTFSGKPRSVSAYRFNEVTQRNERNFFHLYHPKRFKGTASRGITVFAPIWHWTNQTDDLFLARLIQAQSVSNYVIEHQIPVETENYIPPGLGGGAFDDDVDLVDVPLVDTEPGSEYWPIYPGEKLNPVTANVPNPEFFDHAHLLMTLIAVGIGVPLTLLLFDAGKKNFSGQRFELEQAKRSFRLFQRRVSSVLHQPYYRWRLLRRLDQDPSLVRLYNDLGNSFFRCDWGFPGWPYIAPKEDVEADALRVATGQNSKRRVLEERGLTHSIIARENCDDKKLEIQCALDAAQELNAHPYILANEDERVSWREIMPQQLAPGMQMNVLDEPKQTEPEPTDSPPAGDQDE